MTSVRERPIPFIGPMVRATLEGRKTQTRRPVRLTEFGPSQTRGYDWCFRDRRALWNDVSTASLMERCPYGQPGDRLWVRETFIHQDAEYEVVLSSAVPIVPAFTTYRADVDPDGEQKGAGWTSPQVMPRHLSRILLEVKDVRVERLQDISEEDARAEGVLSFGEAYRPFSLDQPITCGSRPSFRAGDYPYRASYAVLWDEIYGDRCLWSSDPWVWVVTYALLEVSGSAACRTLQKDKT